ncbi:hypothetical protein NDI39_06630 [Microcoleus sp. ZQ-A2]|jgi:hypothetical protein|nr:hypothetical protein [Microcoleus sp. FACHB-1]
MPISTAHEGIQSPIGSELVRRVMAFDKIDSFIGLSRRHFCDRADFQIFALSGL